MGEKIFKVSNGFKNIFVSNGCKNILGVKWV